MLFTFLPVVVVYSRPHENVEIQDVTERVQSAEVPEQSDMLRLKRTGKIPRIEVASAPAETEICLK